MRKLTGKPVALTIADCESETLTIAFPNVSADFHRQPGGGDYVLLPVNFQARFQASASSQKHFALRPPKTRRAVTYGTEIGPGTTR